MEINKDNIKLVYDNAIKEIKNHIFKIDNKDYLAISSSYPGIWLEHTYDALMYYYLFGDISVAKNTILFFIKNQIDGQLPCFYRLNKELGYSQIQECVSFFNLAFKVYEIINDISFLNTIYDAAKKYISFLMKYRMTENKGLVEIFVGYDTGHDNSKRIEDLKYKGYYAIDGKRIGAKIKPNDLVIFGIDLASNFYMNLKTISKMAHILNKKDEEKYYYDLAINQKNKILKCFYDEKDLCFYDLNYDLRKRRIKSSTMFHVLLEHVLDIKSDKKIIDSLINNIPDLHRCGG